jgi:phosphoglycolate phosphatase
VEMENTGKYRAVVFDLDGTLLDTLEDIATAANATLAELGEPELELQAYRELVGEGVLSLLERAVRRESAGRHNLAQAVQRLEHHYGQCWNQRTRPYRGIPELLNALEGMKLPTAVLSNKPHGFTTLCVEQLLAQWRFEMVLGAQEGRPRKPDPSGLLEVLEGLKVKPWQVLYLGDTAIDMQTAVAAGCYPVGVSWGFRSHEELLAGGALSVISHPEQLLEML